MTTELFAHPQSTWTLPRPSCVLPILRSTVLHHLVGVVPSYGGPMFGLGWSVHSIHDYGDKQKAQGVLFGLVACGAWCLATGFTCRGAKYGAFCNDGVRSGAG